MSEILYSIYIWLFLVNTEGLLLLALVRYMSCSHFTQNCILLYFLEAKNPYFVTKNCWKSFYICVFIFSKKRCIWFHKNPHNSGTVGGRKLPDPSLNRIFNALSIGVQCMLSFQWTNFGRKCLLHHGLTSVFFEMCQYIVYTLRKFHRKILSLWGVIKAFLPGGVSNPKF